MSATEATRRAAPMIPPHDLDAEESVLGAVLLTDRVLQHLVIESGLDDEDFYRDAHRHIYSAMRTLHQAGEPVDMVPVDDQLRRNGTLEAVGGTVALDNLAGCVPAAAHAPRYARIVKDLALARRLLSATHEIQADIAERRHDGDALIEDAERRVFALRSHSLPGRQRLLEDAVSEELERLEQSGENSPNGFIAMWFDPSQDIAKDAIKSAVLGAGYNPIRIDEVQHVNKIDDEIVARIRQSKFVVADFTGQRQGVYFEAGFMLGLGRPVIWLCNQSDFKEVHFDARQYNTIVYTDPSDLRLKLQFRIEAILGKGPIAS